MGQIIALLLVFLLSISPPLTEVALAQTQVQTRDRFTTMDECVMAVESGQFTFYTPSDLSKGRIKASAEEVRPLEERACVEMFIVGSRYAFVPQPAGTEFVFHNGVPVRRWDCGNQVRQVRYVQSPSGNTQASTQQGQGSETRTETKTLMVPAGTPIHITNTNTNNNTPSIPELKYPENGKKDVGRKGWLWGLLGGALAGGVIWALTRGRDRNGDVNINITNNQPNPLASPQINQPPVVTTLPPTAGPTVNTTSPTGGSNLPVCTALPCN